MQFKCHLYRLYAIHITISEHYPGSWKEMEKSSLVILSHCRRILMACNMTTRLHKWCIPLAPKQPYSCFGLDESGRIKVNHPWVMNISSSLQPVSSASALRTPPGIVCKGGGLLLFITVMNICRLTNFFFKVITVHPVVNMFPALPL